MYERHHEPLLPIGRFWRRLTRNFLAGTLVLLAALGVGITGYHVIEGLAWVDAFLEASMILAGMGPVMELHTQAGKLFAGCYALFSGLAFAALLGFVFAPIVHRFMHKFHVAHRNSSVEEDPR